MFPEVFCAFSFLVVLFCQLSIVRRETEVWMVVPSNIYRIFPARFWNMANFSLGFRVVRRNTGMEYRIPRDYWSFFGVLFFKTYTDEVANQAITKFLDCCISKESTLIWTGAAALENDFFVRPYNVHFIVRSRNYQKLLATLMGGSWSQDLEWSSQVTTQCLVPRFMPVDLELTVVDVFIRSDYPCYFHRPVTLKVHIYVAPDMFAKGLPCPTPVLGFTVSIDHGTFLKPVQHFNGFNRCYSYMKRSQKRQILSSTSDIEFVVTRVPEEPWFIQVPPYDIYEWMQFFTFYPRFVTLVRVTDPTIDMCSICFQSRVELEAEARENASYVRQVDPFKFDIAYFMKDVLAEDNASSYANYSSSFFRSKCGCNVNYCVSCFLHLAKHEMIRSENQHTKMDCNYCKRKSFEAMEQVSELMLFNMFELCRRKGDCLMPGDK
jgi:hypothetical protein